MAGSVVDGLPFQDDKKKYITDVLDPILEEMVADVLTEMPKSPHEFMIEWLRRRNGSGPSDKKSMSGKNQQLRKQLRHATSSLEEVAREVSMKGGEMSEEEEEDDDDEDEIPEGWNKPEAQMGRARQSVSAEAYGQWNQKKAFTPPSYPKTSEQTDRLNQTLQKSFLFAALEKQDMDIILLAMKECNFAEGTKVITEGEDGDYLFVIETGTLDCTKVIDGAEKTVKTCVPGDVFGELSLLYNCPRAANVVAKGACICWQLDRETFNHIVKEAAVKRRNKYDTFLKNVALISSIEPYERSQIADALKPESFSKGESVVKEGDPGDKFYIIEEGVLYATKNMPGEGEKKVMDYKAGDYFGELALLKNQPRAASVIVQSDNAKVLSMTRASFNKMLGPLHSLIARASTNYQ